MRITLPFPKDKFPQDNQSGQAFLEFLMLLMILITLSYGLMAGINSAIGVRWEALVKLISNPTTSDVKLN